MLIVNILYSPPPDGDDASSTYADRAVEYLNSINKEVSLGYVGPLKVNDDDNDDRALPWYIEQNKTTEDKAITIFLISCSADGSVHRNVRKIMRKIPKDTVIPNNNNDNKRYYYAIAALGHARCENSANQMADTIFATVRQFDKVMSSSGMFVDTCSKWNRLETQVELTGPEVDFDPWLKSLIQSM